MNLFKINKMWFLQCYNYVYILSDLDVDSEEDVHDYLKQLIIDYCRDDNKDSSQLFNVIDYNFLMFIYNAVKTALYQGLVEQPLEISSNNDTIIMKIESDNYVRILVESDYDEDTFLDKIEPISLDELECLDDSRIKELKDGISKDKEECINKANAIRSMINKEFSDRFSDADLCIIAYEGLLTELS